MNLRCRQPERTRALAIVVAVSCLLMSSSRLQAQTKKMNLRGRPGMAKVALVTRNLAGPAHAGVLTEVTTALSNMLRHNGYFSLVGSPAGNGDMGSALNNAKTAGAELLLVAELTRVDTDPALIEVKSMAFHTSGHLAAETYAMSRSNRLPKGQRYSGIPQLAALVAEETLEQLTETSQLQGIVVSRNEGGMVRISLGGLENLRNGARVQFGSGNDIIGGGEVVELDDGQATVMVRPRFAYARVERNTPVSVVYNPPPYAAGRSVKENSLRAERVDDIEFGVALTMAVLGTFVFKPGIVRSFYR